MFLCMCVSAYLYVCTYFSSHIHTYVRTCVCVCVVFQYIREAPYLIHMYVFILIRTMFLCMCVSAYLYVRTSVHTFIHTYVRVCVLCFSILGKYLI